MPAVLETPEDVLRAASDGAGVDRATELDHVLGLAARGCFDVCEDRLEIRLLSLQEGVEESGQIRGGLVSGARRAAAHLLQGNPGLAEQLIPDLDTLHQIDRDVLARPVLLDRR